MDTSFLEKRSYIHSCSTHAVLVSSGCLKVDSASKVAGRQNMDWIFSDVCVLCVNKWGGLDQGLKRLSLP